MGHHQWVVKKPEVTPHPLTLSLLRLGVGEGGEEPRISLSVTDLTLHWFSSVLALYQLESSSPAHSKTKKS